MTADWTAGLTVLRTAACWGGCWAALTGGLSVDCLASRRVALMDGPSVGRLVAVLVALTANRKVVPKARQRVVRWGLAWAAQTVVTWGQHWAALRAGSKGQRSVSRKVGRRAEMKGEGWAERTAGLTVL